jgi:hypothetical protein
MKVKKQSLLRLTEPKRHSVRYDSDDHTVPIRTVYVMKQALTIPYPNQITLTVEWDQ